MAQTIEAALGDAIERLCNLVRSTDNRDVLDVFNTFSCIASHAERLAALIKQAIECLTTDQRLLDALPTLDADTKFIQKAIEPRWDGIEGMMAQFNELSSLCAMLSCDWFDWFDTSSIDQKEISKTEHQFEHTPGFDSITVLGDTIPLNARQASVMQLLWERAKCGHPCVPVTLIADECDVENWGAIFRDCPAKRFIKKPINPTNQKPRKGFVVLSFADHLKNLE